MSLWHIRSVAEISSYKTYAYDNLKKSAQFAKGHDLKSAVIAPSMMYLLYPLDGEIEGYPKEKFVQDLVSEVSEPEWSTLYSVVERHC